MIAALQPAAGFALGLYARLLGATARLQLLGEEHLLAAQSGGRPLIYASWHGQTHLLYPLIPRRIDASKIVMMVVGDERAGVLQQFARTVGIASYPVATADQSMSGARNLMRLIQRMRQGSDSYMTPDGPDGPARQAKDGVIFLAQRAEAMIVPLGAYSRSCYRLRRWDRYALPLPFSRVYAAVQPGIPAAANEDPELLRETLSSALDAAVVAAQRAGGASGG